MTRPKCGRGLSMRNGIYITCARLHGHAGPCSSESDGSCERCGGTGLARDELHSPSELAAMYSATHNDSLDVAVLRAENERLRQAIADVRRVLTDAGRSDPPLLGPRGLAH